MLLRTLRRALKNFRELLSSFIVTGEEKEFRATNSAFWKNYTHGGFGAEFVLVEQQANPIINHCNASFAAIACHAKNLRPLYLLNFWRDQAQRRALSSYGEAPVFTYNNSFRYLWPRCVALLQAWRTFRTLRHPVDILDIHVDGIKFGDILYDNVLVLGYATIRKLDIKVFAVLYAFYVHRHIIQDIIRRFRPKAAIFSHTIGLTSGIYTRYLLKHNIEVINRVGSKEIVLIKYRDLSGIGYYPLKPEPHYFRHMNERIPDVILPLASAYIDERHNQKVDQIAVELAFNRDKRFFKSREEFCQQYGFDPRKKTAFVMLHAFNDHPHSHFATRMLYQDYFDWFAKTLDIAQRNPNVNWVFKEHPASEFYLTKDVNLEGMFEKINSPHVRFLNSRANFNALSIRFVADVIITCLGTAGMEYACLGIPCVLAGESPYSGFGFTVEPSSVAQYEDYLGHLDRLKKLDQRQIAAAKIVAFFQLCLLRDSPYLFCPQYGFREIAEITSSTVWRDSARLLKDVEPALLKDQIDELSRFIREPGYTQYVNQKKFPFMTEAVQKPCPMPIV
jgi:hypothetical protein